MPTKFGEEPTNLASKVAIVGYAWGPAAREVVDDDGRMGTGEQSATAFAQSSAKFPSEIYYLQDRIVTLEIVARHY